jgi:hypothetical protein
MPPMEDARRGHVEEKPIAAPGSDCSACSRAADKMSCGMPAAYSIFRKTCHVVADSENLAQRSGRREVPEKRDFEQLHRELTLKATFQEVRRITFGLPVTRRQRTDFKRVEVAQALGDCAFIGCDGLTRELSRRNIFFNPLEYFVDASVSESSESARRGESCRGDELWLSHASI